MSTNVNYDALFNMLQFNLYKSLIPIGIQDHDARRLAQVHDVDIAMIQQVISEIGENNAVYAKKLAEKFNLAKLAERPVKLAFLGDSITSDRQSYFNILRKAMAGRENVTFLDFSISGQKSGDLFTIMYPNIISVHADIAHIMIGTNDMRRMDDDTLLYHTSPAEYEKNLDYMVRELIKDGTKVILTTLSPVSQAKAKENYPNHRLLFLEEDRILFNDIIKRVAKKHGAIVNDMDALYGQYPVEELTIEDGLHLNALGQEVLTYGVVKTLLSIV